MVRLLLIRLRVPPGFIGPLCPGVIIDSSEGPCGAEPLADGTPKWQVETGPVYSNPRSHASVVGSVVRWVDVDAADHLVASRREHGVCESDTVRKVRGVPLEIAAIVVERHLVRPSTAESGGGKDVPDR